MTKSTVSTHYGEKWWHADEKNIRAGGGGGGYGIAVHIPKQ